MADETYPDTTNQTGRTVRPISVARKVRERPAAPAASGLLPFRNNGAPTTNPGLRFGSVGCWPRRSLQNTRPGP